MSYRIVGPQSATSTSAIDYKMILGVLGSFIFFLGFALLLPMFIDFVYNEHTWQAFLVSAGISFILGGSLYWFFKPDREVRIREAMLIVAGTWLALSFVGALPFMLTGVLSNYTDAFFETMSGLTTTGATIFGGTTHTGQTNPAIEDLPNSLLFWRSLSHWLGGMGIIVLSIAILPLLGIGGMQLFQAESPGPKSDKLTPRVQQTAKLLWAVYFALTFVEFLLLWIHPSMDWFDAINHAFATMATGGFSTKNASIAGFDSAYVDAIITVFMFLAGVNFALHFKLMTGKGKDIFDNRELRFYALVTFIAIGAITVSLIVQQGMQAADALRYGSFQAVAIITTTGFGTHDYELWPSLAMFVLFMAFFTGGSAGSTAGGPKMIRWLILFRNSFREIKQIVHPKAILPVRIGNYVVDPGVLRAVLSFSVLYMCLFGFIALILSAFGLDLMTSLGASIATLGNIGPGWGDVGPTENFAFIPGPAKWILSFAMMIGRLELFTVLVIFSYAFWRE